MPQTPSPGPQPTEQHPRGVAERVLVVEDDKAIRALVTMLMKRLARSNKAQLRKGGDLEDMMGIVPAIYQELHSALPVAQKMYCGRTSACTHCSISSP